MAKDVLEDVKAPTMWSIPNPRVEPGYNPDTGALRAADEMSIPVGRGMLVPVNLSLSLPPGYAAIVQPEVAPMAGPQQCMLAVDNSLAGAYLGVYVFNSNPVNRLAIAKGSLVGHLMIVRTP